jgi:hypothetical protein
MARDRSRGGKGRVRAARTRHTPLPIPYRSRCPMRWQAAGQRRSFGAIRSAPIATIQPYRDCDDRGEPGGFGLGKHSIPLLGRWQCAQAIDNQGEGAGCTSRLCAIVSRQFESFVYGVTAASSGPMTICATTQSKTHHQKSLRLSHLSCAGSCLYHLAPYPKRGSPTDLLKSRLQFLITSRPAQPARWHSFPYRRRSRCRS